VPDRPGRAESCCTCRRRRVVPACRRATSTARAARSCSRPSFETIERSIRDQLGRALGGGGFDPATDILGITVNRWPHGYAYQYNSLNDDFWLNGGEQPCVVARQRFGRIAIANSDAGAYAYTDCAIDHGHRRPRNCSAASGLSSTKRTAARWPRSTKTRKNLRVS
jgi:hypothetical protein